MLTILVAARWLHFAAVFALFGGALAWLVAGPAAAGFPDALARTLRWAGAAATLAALSGVAWLAGTIAYATGGLASLVDPDMLRVFFLDTPFGVPAALRLGLMAALVVVALGPLAPRARLTLVPLFAGALLVSQAWLGHAAEGGASPYGLAMIATYAVHILATAAWLGGLPVLILAAAEARRPVGAAALDRLLRRYSAMATFAVALILASGSANAVFHDGGSLRDFRGTAYGSVLFTKLALVAAMLALAAVNRFALMPRLRTGRTAPLRRFRSSLAVDAGLAAMVLGAAAVLGITPPPQ